MIAPNVGHHRSASGIQFKALDSRTLGRYLRFHRRLGATVGRVRGAA